MAHDLREYLRMRCSRMLLAERDVLRMNQLMTQEVQTPRLKEMLQRHSEPTKQQVHNLEQIVERLGGPVGPKENPLTQALERMHTTFKETNPSQHLLDLHNALEADKVEHLEIVTYNALIALAEQLGEREIVDLLRQNLQGEIEMRDMLERELPSLLSELGGQGRMAA